MCNAEKQETQSNRALLKNLQQYRKTRPNSLSYDG